MDATSRGGNGHPSSAHVCIPRFMSQLFRLGTATFRFGKEEGEGGKIINVTLLHDAQKSRHGKKKEENE